MFINFFILFLILINKKCESRSVSIVVRHQQFFAVQDVGNRGYIPLPETHERLLQLTKPRENVTDREDSAINKDLAGADKVSGSAKHTVESVNHSGNKIDFNDVKSDDDDEYTEDDEEDENNGTTLEDFLYAAPQDTEYSKSDDVNHNDFDIESTSGLKKIFRKKRSANEQWKSSLPGAEPVKKMEDTEPDVWEEVTDEELERAQVHTYRQIAIYVGWTLLSVVGFVVIGICFLRDPIACIFAFGTGCPCCLICCPCIRSFTDKYLDVKRMVREQMNKYMPGVIVNEDGSLDYYQPTGDELNILAEIIDEMQE